MNPLEIQFTLYQLIGVISVIIGGFWTVVLFFGRSLVAQFKQGLEQKFIDLNRSRDEDKKEWEERHSRNELVGAQRAERLITLEATMKHMPTTEEFGQINGRIERLQGETNTQTELLTRIERQMGRINDWMLENK